MLSSSGGSENEDSFEAQDGALVLKAFCGEEHFRLKHLVGTFVIKAFCEEEYFRLKHVTGAFVLKVFCRTYDF